MQWEINMTRQVECFLDDLWETDRVTHRLVNETIQILESNGPAEGRPLVDSLVTSNLSSLKELRPPSSGRSEVRILFLFDPWREAILLVAGDKAGKWNRWYRTAIPEAEQSYALYLKERQEEI
ncbi:hypothetical protein J3R03_008141 [Actinoplanes couchii]|uniref:Uncharacterized protein n=1 Tax=Actinoplanes couchii TaxID=403638 RepID=A0ABQ3XIU6_9ACTN|nr:hypothetical protein [Actinoplanes couchii]GID58414.1 hypothetical protein Aco03nite_068180 [Actinoplanes couchii]